MAGAWWFLLSVGSSKLPRGLERATEWMTRPCAWLFSRRRRSAIVARLPLMGRIVRFSRPSAEMSAVKEKCHGEGEALKFVSASEKLGLKYYFYSRLQKVAMLVYTELHWRWGHTDLCMVLIQSLSSYLKEMLDQISKDREGISLIRSL